MAAEMIPAALALLLPVFLVFTHKYFKYKEKVLELQARGGQPLLLGGAAPGADKQLAELEARVQNLESIIVAMDNELGSLPDRAPREELRRLRGKTATPALPAAAPPSPTKPPKQNEQDE